MKDFSKIIEESTIKMGYILGSNKVLFIKCGQGGSMYGYENKYLDIALAINEKYGYSVFVSEILSDSKEAYNHETEMVKSLLGENCKIYCLGVSKGGLLTLWHGAGNPLIERITTINAPLMINFHNRTRPSIQRIGREKITMIYGTKDPSYSYVPFIASEVNVEIIDGADHILIGGDIKLMDIIENLIK